MTADLLNVFGRKLIDVTWKVIILGFYHEIDYKTFLCEQSAVFHRFIHVYIKDEMQSNERENVWTRAITERTP